jgi:uncharacterized protein YkwD
MTSRFGIVVAAAAVAALSIVASGCGAVTAANKRSPGALEAGNFQPTRTVATNYGADPTQACAGGGVNDLVDQEVGSAAKTEGRLCAMADTLLGWEKEKTGAETPPDSVLQVLSNDFGIPQTVRRVIVQDVATYEEARSRASATQGAKPADLAQMLAEPIKSFASTAVAPRYGVATNRIRTGTTRIVVVMQDQNVDLQPFPRKLAPGQSAKLSGKLLGNLVNPRVQYTDAVGKLEKPEQQPGKTFSAELKCGDRPGRILVQVVAEQEGADVPVAIFPVGCGTDLPVAASVAPGEKATTDPAAASAKLLEMTNKERTAAGLKPLQLDADLSKVARSISDDRAKGKGTTGEEVQRRMKEVEISAPVLLVSEAQAMGAEDAYSRFSNSPQDRSNAMNPDVTHLGIGVAPAAPVNKQPMVVVTELFLKQLPPPDPEAVKADLYKAIERRRGDARAASVSKDAQLEQIAQNYASEMAKTNGKVPKEKISEIEAPLYKAYATVNEMGGVKADPLEFAEEPGVVGDAKLVGVGVGVGSSPQFGKNSTYVVILMGKKHGAAPAKAAPKKPTAKK